MKRFSYAVASLLAVAFLIAGCEDKAAQIKIQEQQQTIQGLNERIGKLEEAVADLQRKSAGKETQERSDRDRLNEIQSLVNARLGQIDAAFQTQLTELRSDVQSMSELIAQRAAEDEAINKKLKDGQLYNENIRTEMESFFQNRMETTLDTMIDNRLRDVYPYLYYHKRY